MHHDVAVGVGNSAMGSSPIADVQGDDVVCTERRPTVIDHGDVEPVLGRAGEQADLKARSLEDGPQGVSEQERGRRHGDPEELGLLRCRVHDISQTQPMTHAIVSLEYIG